MDRLGGRDEDRRGKADIRSRIEGLKIPVEDDVKGRGEQVYV